MKTLMALALNPNLSAKEFEELSRQHLERQKRLMDLMLENAEKMPPEDRAQYIGFCMPFVLT